MCEIHNNIIRVDAFADVFDGFSMGSNDLTQLTRGTDRDSEIGGYRFDRAVRRARHSSHRPEARPSA
jgi:pyruvate, water dikinase